MIISFIFLLSRTMIAQQLSVILIIVLKKEVLDDNDNKEDIKQMNLNSLQSSQA